MTDYFSFNVFIAEKVGVAESIMIRHLDYWINRNKKDERNYREGTYWTYNSAHEFTKIFPFWNAGKIRRILKSLIDQDIIMAKEFNAKKYDHTKWYAFTPLGEQLLAEAENRNVEKQTTISPNHDFDVTKMKNRNGVFTTPIPDNDTYSLPVSTSQKGMRLKNDAKQTVINTITYLNEKAGTTYSCTLPHYYELLFNLIKNGFTLDDFKKVIDTKVADWVENQKMAQYLRPETLFGKKFRTYLNQRPSAHNAAKTGFDDFIHDLAIASGESK